MPPLYTIYLTKLTSAPDSTTPAWDTEHEADFDHGNGWIKLFANIMRDKAVTKDKTIHSAGHIKVKINTGKFVQSVVFSNCIIKNTGDSELSDYYNAFKKFLLRHIASEGSNSNYTLYLRVYNASFGGKYVQWMDSGGDMQNYMKCRILGFEFELTEKGYYTGSIQIEEA